MSRVKKVIFVCTDNVCLSNMAAACLERIKKDPEMDVISRGLVVLFPEPMNPKAVAVMKANKVEPLESEAKVLELTDFVPNTLVLTMTQSEKAKVKEQFPDMPNIFTLLEFSSGSSDDIQEPMGGIMADYGACFEYLDLLVRVAADIIFKEDV